jgi:hypothetical protein
MTQFKIFIFIVSVFCPSASVLSDDDDSREALMQQFSEIISDSISNPQVFEANGFKVKSSQNRELGADLQPNGNEMQFLIVEAEDIFKVGIEKGRPMSEGGAVTVFQRESGVPMLSASDQDGDGRVDILTYGVFDENGQQMLEVIDYEADGQADVRLHLVEEYFEIWHNDRWFRAENRDGVRGIVIDGDFREIINIDNRPFVQ